MAERVKPVSVQDLKLPAWLEKDIQALAEKEESTAIDTFEEFRRAAQLLQKLEKKIEQASLRLGEVTSVTRYEDYVPRVVDLLPRELQQEVVAIQKRGNPSELDKAERFEISGLMSQMRSQLEVSRQRLMALSSTENKVLVWDNYRFDVAQYDVEEGKILRCTEQGERQVIYNGFYHDPDNRFKLGRAIKFSIDDNDLWVLLEDLSREEENNRHVAELRWGSRFESLSGLASDPNPSFLHVRIPPNGMRVRNLVKTDGQIKVVFTGQRGEQITSPIGSLTSFFPVPLGSGEGPSAGGNWTW